MDKTSLTEVWVFVVALFVFGTITYAETTTSSTCPDGRAPVLTILGYVCMDSTSSGGGSTSTTIGTSTTTGTNPYHSSYNTSSTTTPDTAATTASTTATTTIATTATSAATTTTGTVSTTTTTVTENVAQQIIYITPQNPRIYVGEKVYFKAYINGTIQYGLRWVASGGIFSENFDNGVYTAPTYPGVFIITVYNPATYKWATTSVTVILKETNISQTSYTTTTTINTATPTTTYTPPVYTTTYTTTSTVNTTNTLETTSINSEPTKAEYSTQVYKAIETISSVNVNEGSTVSKPPQEEIFLFDKDSNKDGISDYDSIYVYGLDPVKPSPTTVYEGRKINAGEKVLLGFDPKEKDLVEVIPEEPTVSPAPVVEVYRVKDVALTPDKKVSIQGRALPNSFVTVYIYSTPIIVTVKTNEEGEWQYLLDEELADGTHEIYTATVDNTGKILAKSRQFTFVKTAEAATLNSPLSLDVSTEKPSFLGGVNIYIIVLVFGTLLVLALIFIGTKEEPSEPKVADIGPNGSKPGI